MSTTPWARPLKPSLHTADELSQAQAALLSIDGMVCSVCALNVVNALFELNGVFITEVLWAQGKATVAYDPARVNAKQLLQAVSTAGNGTWHYHPHLLSTMPAHAVLVV